jgi:regulator of protease activity HflC (stomatin/prohibitin superfamily)
MVKEKPARTMPGLGVLFLHLLALGLTVYWFVLSIQATDVTLIIASSVVMTVICIGFGGFFIVNPNETKVLQLFGAYRGSELTDGLRWANPFYSKRKVSIRVRNFETGKLKVNDKAGNPIELACVVVWKVIDSAEAVFEVDDFENYVHVQSEAALRNLATGYPYVAHEDHEVSLVTHTAEISDQLKVEIQERLARAGVDVIEARISHLAYAAEIAAAMLQRQQASAVVAARQKIVEGAVGMVETALEMLNEKQVIHLDEERKAAMVSNLLVVLCSDRHTQPVVNTGTLYN